MSNFNSSLMITIFLPFVSLFILIFYIVQKLYTGQFIKWEKGLRDASRESGLKFTNNIFPGLNNYPDLSVLKNKYILRAMRFSLRAYDLKIEGVYKGINMSIHFEEVGNKDDLIVLTAFFPSPLSMELSIQPINPVKNFLKTLKERINSSPVDLKDHVSITTSKMKHNQDKIKSVITSDSVIKLYGLFPQTIISDERILCKKEVIINDDPPNFKNIIKILTDASNMIYTCMSK